MSHIYIGPLHIFPYRHEGMFKHVLYRGIQHMFVQTVRPCLTSLLSFQAGETLWFSIQRSIFTTHDCIVRCGMHPIPLDVIHKESVDTIDHWESTFIWISYVKQAYV